MPDEPAIAAPTGGRHRFLRELAWPLNLGNPISGHEPRSHRWRARRAAAGPRDRPLLQRPQQHDFEAHRLDRMRGYILALGVDMLQPPIGILKSLWSRQPNGRWGVTGAKGLSLHRRPGFEEDYFTFESSMEQLTSTPSANLHEMFASFGPTDFLMKQSVVPVVAWKDGDRWFLRKVCLVVPALHQTVDLMQMAPAQP